MTMTAQELVADARARIREIDPADVPQDRDHVVVIDVREPAEFANGHLPGAINIPRGVLEFQLDAHPAVANAGESSHKDRPLVVYCLSGGRAALSADNLQKLGFSDVRSIRGGITAWTQAGLPVMNG